MSVRAISAAVVQAELRNRWCAAVGAVLALAAGALAAANPLIMAVAGLGLGGLVVILALPLCAVAVAVLSDGVVFPLLISGESTSRLSLMVLGSVGLATVSALVRRKTDPTISYWVVGMVAMLVPSMLISVFTLPLRQTLSGIRYLTVPLMVGILSSALSDSSMRKLLRAGAALMFVSFVATIIETSLGSDRLLELTQLDYGTSIRNFGDALRAPGTFATNYHLGAYSAVFCVIALLWWGTLDGASADWLWRFVGVLSSLGCLGLSTYRTGVVILVVSVLAAVFLSGRAVASRFKVLVVSLGLTVAIAFFAIGLGNTRSFFQRLDVWASLLSGSISPLGRGVGSAGAASGAAGSSGQVFTDNYYLSLWLQFGIAGLVMITVFGAVLVRLVLSGGMGSRRAALAAPLWAGVLVGFFFVELWEYTSAMCLVSAVVCSALAGQRGGVEGAGTSPPTVVLTVTIPQIRNDPGR